jgi:antitoxin component of RelBE/YafQ-DinJ toxin-antitoxin module
MNTAQVQLKISLSEQLNELLKSKAERLGLPVTQLVKFLIVKEVETEEYPTYQMSDEAEKKIKEAMEDYHAGKAVKVNDISKFFRNL